MKYRQPITISEIISIIRSKEDEGESYCIYGKGESSDAELSTVCYLDQYADVTDDNEEIFPEFVTSNDLELWYREELVQDVILNALHQNESVTDEKILEAIKHYDARDCFLDLA